MIAIQVMAPTLASTKLSLTIPYYSAAERVAAVGNPKDFCKANFETGLGVQTLSDLSNIEVGLILFSLPSYLAQGTMWLLCKFSFPSHNMELSLYRTPRQFLDWTDKSLRFCMMSGNNMSSAVETNSPLLSKYNI